MKILLRKDVKGVGRRGDIAEVKSGFFRNYLLPNGVALAATDSMADQSASMRKGRDLRDAATRQAAEVQRDEIAKATLSIAARAGGNGRLFGSVTEADIVNAIRTATNVSLDRHQVTMAEHIKMIGTSQVEISLFEGVTAVVTVEVTAKA
ncbi:MAG: 50S ribosomal protein L9 [Actinomycetota bacterium]|jgi:large subunit ribosomal protein L9